MHNYPLNIHLKEESHLQLIKSLINGILYNFIKRYCTYDKQKHIYKLSESITEIYFINLWNYIWDSFNHMYNLEKYKDVNYLTVAEQNEIFSMILCIIDETIISREFNNNNEDGLDDDKPQEI